MILTVGGIKGGSGKTTTLYAALSEIKTDEDKIIVSRARKIQFFLTQPMHVAEAFTGKPGEYVKIEDTIRGFKGLVDGEYDDVPELAFFLVGNIEQALEAAKDL